MCTIMPKFIEREREIRTKFIVTLAQWQLFVYQRAALEIDRLP
jgi:hypothetical protein